MKRFISLVIFCCIYFLAVLPVHADYVLPYPSYMPGNKLFKVSRMIDRIKTWWYWGSLSQVKYNMELADKYLVEAKTLFEYKQYLLAMDALQLSDEHIMPIASYIKKAATEGKDVQNVQHQFTLELDVHGETLSRLRDELPAVFVWTPEKQAPVVLHLVERIERSISLRASLK